MTTATSPPPAPPRWQLPRIDEDDRWLTGTAAGIAREVGVQPIVIRASFLLLIAAGGWGGAFYLVAWIIMTQAEVPPGPYIPEPKAESTTHRHIGVGLVLLGMVLFLRLVDIGFVDGIVWPAGLVFTGALIAWSHGRDREDGFSTIARILAGVAVAIGGLIAFGALSFQLRDGLLAIVFAMAVVAGVAVIASPSIMRIVAELNDERQERLLADERARVAAHLHDSVLQTLTLIQRHADDPAVTSKLARRQERELRNWLYAPETPLGYVRLSHALNDIAAKIETDHGVAVEVVVVGDEAMEAVADKQLEALLGATREAVTNAAKHSGAPQVDVFAEIRNGRVEIFIRDTGTGFKRSSVAADRIGVLESIEGRMERHGGTAKIHSEPGQGTEVELVLHLTERPTDANEDVDENGKAPRPATDENDDEDGH